ncbi:MAG: hypothetical protein RIQ33_643 [Bacteroidota bacterium]|jgi:uncharacterized protein YdeI (YjbR/CyaY-like superfamily)
MNTPNDKVNWFFEKETKWKNEYELLREIALSCDVVEELKWGCPCYTINKTNVVLIHGFKDYCALLFHKGVLIKDEKKLLIQQTENVQAARQMRFSNLREIEKLKKTIQAYIKEAITLEKSGAKVQLKTTAEYNMPDEFKKVLDEMNDVKKAFEALTPGRQRGYLYFFSQPKQAKTRDARIEKAIPNILKGKGIDD